MPRLMGYRELLYSNLYDAAKVLVMDEYTRLFNSSNIGHRELTNMTVAGQLDADMTFVIANVYTRTNMGRSRSEVSERKLGELKQLFVDGHDGDAIGTVLRDLQWERTPLLKALDEWAHSAIVEVVIGNKPMFSMNAFDLFDGPALGPDYRHEQKVKQKEGERAMESLPWRKALAVPIIVPVRQNISVTITSQRRPLEALKREATKAGVLPEPLAWVHLEGLMTRDVH